MDHKSTQNGGATMYNSEILPTTVKSSNHIRQCAILLFQNLTLMQFNGKRLEIRCSSFGTVSVFRFSVHFASMVENSLAYLSVLQALLGGVGLQAHDLGPPDSLQSGEDLASMILGHPCSKVSYS